MPVAAGETWPRAAFGADQGPWRGSQGTGQTVATKICHSFQRAGWCRWGTKCKFSHDLREPLSPHTLENRVWSERTVRIVDKETISIGSLCKVDLASLGGVVTCFCALLEAAGSMQVQSCCIHRP